MKKEKIAKGIKKPDLYLGGEKLDVGELQAHELKTFFVEFMYYLLHGKKRKK